MNEDSRRELIHFARVYLAQSRHFTSRHRGWSFRLLEWAANKRRQIAAMREEPAECRTGGRYSAIAA